MGAKDWLVEKAGVAVLNQAVLKPYGSITKLKLDTTARTIEAELELKGETELLRLHVQEYRRVPTSLRPCAIPSSRSAIRQDPATTQVDLTAYLNRFEIMCLQFPSQQSDKRGCHDHEPQNCVDCDHAARLRTPYPR